MTKKKSEIAASQINYTNQVLQKPHNRTKWINILVQLSASVMAHSFIIHIHGEHDDLVMIMVVYCGR